MNRRSLFALAVVAILWAFPAIASAGGWDNPIGNPHRNYTTSTDKCKVCHAVHEADNAANTFNGEKLLRTTTAGACDYCHVGGPFAGSITQVYNSTVASYSADTGFEHTLGSSVSVPDSNDSAGQADPSNDYVIGTFDCQTCHSVHGANIINIVATKILRQDPLGDGDTAATTTAFCADCHDNNYVTAKDTGAVGTDQASHYMGAVTSATLASTASSDCRSCHNGGATAPANSYPHLTSGLQFLNDNYDQSTWELDGVCLQCHPNVGNSF